MIITCENCSTRFTLDETLIKPEGSKVRCSQCRHVFMAMPPAPEPQEEILELDTLAASEPEEEEAELSFDLEGEEEDDQEISFDDSFEALEFDQDLAFDKDELSFESEEVAPQEDTLEEELEETFEGADDEPTFEIDEDEIEFDASELDFSDLGMEEDSGVDPAEEPGSGTQTDVVLDADAFADLEMEIPGQETDGDDDGAVAVDELEFEDLEMVEEEPSQDTGGADIEISFDEDDAPQDLAALPLEMDGQDSDEIDFETGDLSFETDELEFETDDIAFESEEPEAAAPDLTEGLEMDVSDQEFPEQDASGLTMETEGSPQEPPTQEDQKSDGLEMDGLEMEGPGQEIQADEILEPDLDLSFEDDLEMDEIQFDDPAPLDEADGTATEDTPAFPEVEDFHPDDEDFEADPILTPDDDLDDFDTDLEDQKFAEYDQVLDQETEPGEAFAEPAPEAAAPAPEETAPALDQAPAPRWQAPAGSSPLIDPEAEPDGDRRRKKRRGGLGAPVKILLLLFLLVIAAYLITLRLGIHVPFLDQVNIPFVTQAFKPAPPPVAATGPIPNDASTSGRFLTNASAGRLFIITGKVDNPDAVAYSHIQVRGTLLTKGNKKAATQLAYCGNVISEEVLKLGNITDIASQLSVKPGRQNANINIKPGASVHFMLVFANLPENLTNFTVEVLSYDPAGPQ